MTDTVRLLWTASRDWDDPVLCWEVASECLGWARAQGKTLVIVHGDAAGGDQFGKLFGEITPGAAQEPHPADWEGPCRTDDSRCKPGHRRTNRRGREYCPMAGHYRNEHMVSLGLDRGVAFIKDRSGGATGCSRLMKEAGTRPRIYEA